MSSYLYPNLKSKAAYKRAISAGTTEIVARPSGPMGTVPENGKTAFEGPHYPEPHRFYGTATIVDGRVTKVS